MIVMLLATANFLGACNSADSGSDSRQAAIGPYHTACSVSFDTFAQGVESGFLIDQYTLEEPTLFIIRNQDELEEFWTIHASIFFPQPAIPLIDFTVDMLIAVVDTVEPTGGFALYIESLNTSGDEVSVQVRKLSPGPDDIVTDALTVPYHIITLSRSDMQFRLQLIEERG